MRTGFLMTNTCVHKKTCLFKKRSEKLNEWMNSVSLSSQQAHNAYTTLVLGYIYVTSYMNVHATLLQHL